MQYNKCCDKKILKVILTLLICLKLSLLALDVIDSPLLRVLGRLSRLSFCGGEVGLYLLPCALSQSARRAEPRRPISDGLAPSGHPSRSERIPAC